MDERTLRHLSASAAEGNNNLNSDTIDPIDFFFVNSKIPCKNYFLSSFHAGTNMIEIQVHQEVTVRYCVQKYVTTDLNSNI
mmetsp:Transcript_12212/g.16023  ORF Transcript_12212/g.16023 Transcript_12212/m.16023 type:complete len:81 (+) Transcript_12212:1156-1398(+)